VHKPLVFVTYGGAISYAETIMGVVVGHQLRPIVDEATAGSNGNNKMRLPTRLLVGLTRLRVQKHDGSPSRSTRHSTFIASARSEARSAREVG
jgi:hypothetical protein